MVRHGSRTECRSRRGWPAARRRRRRAIRRGAASWGCSGTWSTSPDGPAGGVDFDALAERGGGQPEPGRGQQHRAGGLAGPQPVERCRRRRWRSPAARRHRRPCRARAAGGLGEPSVREPAQREAPMAPTGPGRCSRRYAVAGTGVAAGPELQLGGVAGGGLWRAASARAAVSRSRIASVTGRSTAPAAAPARPGRAVLGRDRAVAHAAAVGASAVDRREQGRVRQLAGTGPNRHGGEVPGVLRVGQAVDLGLEPLRGQRHEQVVQGGPAAEHEVAAVGVGGDQVPVPVGMQLHGVVGDAPPPGLGVVHRRGA